MRKPIKRAAYACILTGLGLFLAFCPGLPWSRQNRHALSRLVTKVEMKVSAWQGEQPKLVSLSGRVVLQRPRKEYLQGAEVEALDSTSGWASLTDQHGEFLLRDVTWYPRAAYTLIIVASDYQARQIQVSAPAVYPEGRVVKLGDVEFFGGCKVDVGDLPGKNSISYGEFDNTNIEFYKQVFEDITQDKVTDEERISAINRYVATKLNVSQTDARDELPRRIIENGSAYCGKLALALATIAEAGDYRARLLDVIDEAKPAAHMVTEIYYGERWHVYDPTAGACFRLNSSRRDKLASFRDLRLNPELVSFALPNHLPAVSDAPDNWPVAIYRSGLHHYYYLKRTQ